MSDSIFKGPIRTGSITAKFFSDFSNLDSDLLVMSFAPRGGGNPQVDQGATSPGGTVQTTVDAAQRGVLEVWVVSGHSSDSGRLVLSRNGSEVNNEPVQGSVRWVYAVEAS